MKFLILLFLIVSCSTLKSTQKSWDFTENIANPESVYFDKASGHTFIANVNGAGDGKDGKGHISLVSKSGQMINAKWITGLNAPKGMRAHQGMLYVSDIDRVHQIDIKKGKVTASFIVRNAKFLNDVAITKNGTIYVSDTLTSKIHKILNSKVTTFVAGKKYESPNGLLVHGDRLYVAAWGLTTDWSTKKSGRLYSISLKNRRIRYISKAPLGNLDGLEIKKNGNFIVSDWVAGKIFEIEPNGKTTTIFTGKKGLADIGFIHETNKILIPYMLDNKVFSL